MADPPLRSTGRLNVELPELYVASIGVPPVSFTPSPWLLAIVYPLPWIKIAANAPLAMLSLLVSAVPERPAGKTSVSPACPVGAAPPSQLFGSDQLSLGVVAVVSAPVHVSVGGWVTVSTTSCPEDPPWYVITKSVLATWSTLPSGRLAKVPVIPEPPVLCRIVNDWPTVGVNEPSETLSAALARLIVPPATSWS